MRRIAWGLARVAVTLGLLLLPACGPRGRSEDKIGVLIIRTGSAAADQVFGMGALTLAARELNRVAGAPPVRLVVADADGDPAHAVAAFRHLVEQEHVAAVIAAASSGEVLACAPFANRSQTILLTTAATSSDIRESGDYVFRNVASATDGADVLAQAVAGRHPGAPIAIVYPELDFGVSYRDQLISVLSTRGAPIPELAGYRPRSRDLGALSAALRRSRAEVVVVVGSEGDFGPIVRELRAIGSKAQLFLGGDVSDGAIREIGPSAEGLIAAVDRFDLNGKDPRTQSFVRDYRDQLGTDPSYIGAAMYDALSLLAGLLRQGAVSGPALRDALYASHGFPSVRGGELTFDRDGEMVGGSRLVVVRGGEIVTME